MYHRVIRRRSSHYLVRLPMDITSWNFGSCLYTRGVGRKEEGGGRRETEFILILVVADDL